VRISHDNESPAVGYVIGVYFDDAEGFYVADFFLNDEQAEAMVCSGDYFPSCNYIVEERGDGGVYNDIEYQCEVLKARFEHLAMVDSPRYSCGVFDFDRAEPANQGKKPIFELKAINSGGMMASKKSTAKNEGEEEKDKTEGETAQNNSEESKKDGETSAENGSDGGESVLDGVIVINGKEIPIGEAVEQYRAATAKKVWEDEERIDIDGTSVTIKEIKEKLGDGGSAPEPTPAENEGEEEEKEEEPKPTASNSSTKTNGVQKMKKAISVSNSTTINSNRRLPNETAYAYNERMTKKVF